MLLKLIYQIKVLVYKKKFSIHSDRSVRKWEPMHHSQLERTLMRVAGAVAGLFGPGCEVVIHDVRAQDLDSTIIFIENGEVSGRKLGDGPSQAVLTALKDKDGAPEDQVGYLMKTSDGKVIKSSTVYIRDDSGQVHYVFAVNFDISALLAAQTALAGITQAEPGGDKPEKISNNVNDLLDALIEESVRRVGKPVALMSREDKIRAINFLNDAGALLITRSSEKICRVFDISKYTMYSYIDQLNSKSKPQQ